LPTVLWVFGGAPFAARRSMSFEMKLGLRQSQKMIMTPMLQQAINLLQLPKLELVRLLRKELEENPVLEEVPEEVQGGFEEGTEGVSQEGSSPTGEDDGEDPIADFDWDAYLEGASDYRPELPREDVERPDPERYLTKPRSLHEHLMFQLYLSTSDEELKRLGALIIGNLDENGYFTGVEGSPLFRMDDFKDPTGFALKLRDAQDPISRYLRGRFSPETQRLLDEYTGSSPPSKSLQTALICELNQLIQGDCFYDERLFQHIPLTPEIEILIKHNPQGRELIRLNRILLERVYPHELAKSLMEELDQEALERALRLVQSFEPIGVAARDLKECFLLQLRAMGEGTDLAQRIVSDYLDDLKRKQPQKLAEKLGVSVAEVQSALDLIASLDPAPGRNFSVETPQYITPDVFIIKVDDRFVVLLDEEGLPRLRISPYYRALLSKRASCPKEVREYVEERMRSALWLIKSIHQRQRTLYKVTESIVKFQGEFLEKGITALRPLTLREVADDIGMHESTVSRVTTNKYVQTPQGLFELKYFFHRGVPAADGESVSSLKVKDLVRRYLITEGRKPLSDQKIAEILRKEHGIAIARRTVAKYRAQLKIPSSSQRKRV